MKKKKKSEKHESSSHSGLVHVKRQLPNAIADGREKYPPQDHGLSHGGLTHDTLPHGNGLKKGTVRK